MNLQSASNRLARAAFMVTYERDKSRLWVGDGKGRFLAYVLYDARNDNYEVRFCASRDFASNAETVVRWMRCEANDVAQQYARAVYVA